MKSLPEISFVSSNELVGKTIKAVRKGESEIAILFEDGTVYGVEAHQDSYDDSLSLFSIDNLSGWYMRDLGIISEQDCAAYYAAQQETQRKARAMDRYHDYLLLKKEFEEGSLTTSDIIVNNVARHNEAILHV